MPRRFRFGLVHLFAVLTIVAMLCGIFGARVRTHWSLRRLESIGAVINYSSDGEVSSITYSGKLFDSQTADAIINASPIHTVKIRGCEVKREGLDRLYLMPSLRNLILSGSHIEKGALGRIERASGLRWLVLDEAKADAGEFGEVKSATVGLVSLKGTDISDSEVLSLLAKCPQLKALYLTHTRIRGDKWEEAVESQLELLDVRCTALGDSAIEGIVRWQRLHTLYAEATLLSDVGLAGLVNCRSLKELSVDRRAISQPTADSFRRRRSIVTLTLVE